MVYETGIYFFLQTISGFMIYTNQNYSSITVELFNNLITTSAQNIIDRENIDYSEVFKCNLVHIFELFSECIPYIPPNYIPTL